LTKRCDSFEIQFRSLKHSLDDRFIWADEADQKTIDEAE